MVGFSEIYRDRMINCELESEIFITFGNLGGSIEKKVYLVDSATSELQTQDVLSLAIYCVCS